MKLDFSEIGNNVMPEGENLVTIFGAKETVSKNGSSMLVLDMKNADGAFVRDYVVLGGAGAFRARQFFKMKKLRLRWKHLISLAAKSMLKLQWKNITAKIVLELKSISKISR